MENVIKKDQIKPITEAEYFLKHYPNEDAFPDGQPLINPCMLGIEIPEENNPERKPGGFVTCGSHCDKKKCAVLWKLEHKEPHKEYSMKEYQK